MQFYLIVEAWSRNFWWLFDQSQRTELRQLGSVNHSGRREVCMERVDIFYISKWLIFALGEKEMRE